MLLYLLLNVCILYCNFHIWQLLSAVRFSFSCVCVHAKVFCVFLLFVCVLFKIMASTLFNCTEQLMLSVFGGAGSLSSVVAIYFVRCCHGLNEFSE